MTRQQWLQSIVDSADAKTQGIALINATFADKVSMAATPTPIAPPPPPPPPAPVIKRIMQSSGAWAHMILAGAVAATTIANEVISDGGFLQTTSPLAPIHLVNVCNEKGNQAPRGRYFLMAWPAMASATVQAAVPQIILDNRQCLGAIYQGIAEAAIRLKCDDFQMLGGHIIAHLQPANGNQVKPIVEIRHGKSFIFDGTIFDGGWPEIGEQQTLQPVGQVLFRNGCRFTRWENALTKSVISRKPGVDKIIFDQCIGPDGKIFSATL
jgi:hypothetical protein